MARYNDNRSSFIFDTFTERDQYLNLVQSEDIFLTEAIGIDLSSIIVDIILYSDRESVIRVQEIFDEFIGIIDSDC